LTTRGRKTGKLRRTALIYGRAGKSYLLVASNGGAPNHPLYVVLSHSVPEKPAKGETKFIFVSDGVESALHQARAAASDRAVVIGGAPASRSNF